MTGTHDIGEAVDPHADSIAEEIRERTRRLLADFDPARVDRLAFLRARFAAGLAWVHFPPGLGGMGVSRSYQSTVESVLRSAGAPDNSPARIGIGLGMAAPTILKHGTPQQRYRFLPPLWTGEETWCQLFSEPGAGSDLASLQTRAVRVAEDWVINGQKVWTSGAHVARWGLLLARTNGEVPKHRGLTYFICDMRAAGIEVRPLRQLTGDAEFNEVFLSDVHIPDEHRLGEVGDGWQVAQTTLNSERVAIGGSALPRGGGMISALVRTWRHDETVRSPYLYGRLIDLWVEAEMLRLTSARLRQQVATGEPGPEGVATKLIFAQLNQAISGLDLELQAEHGLRYDDWSDTRSSAAQFTQRGAGYRYLRSRGNSIEGGTSEILLNIVAERILGLPREPDPHSGKPWSEVPR